MSLNLIGGASGVCHFLAISGLVLAWGGGVVGVGGAEARVPGIREGSLGIKAQCYYRRPEEAGGSWGSSKKTEKEQAKLGYFNLINDCTPLRVCFNNQDTLQQVDRMFAVNLHMSSEQAVNINKAGASGCSQALRGEAAGRTPTSHTSPHPFSLCLGVLARGVKGCGNECFFPFVRFGWDHPLWGGLSHQNKRDQDFFSKTTWS